MTDTAPFRVLVTCPPMLGMLQSFKEIARSLGLELIPADVNQTLSEDELVSLLPEFDGWIIGDDPATRKVFTHASKGSLKAAVKWGIGTDNVDFQACQNLKIPVINTPGMFGREVSDIATGYVIALARHTVEIDRSVREGKWIKPCGISLADRTVALIGYGDIGRNTAKRLLAADMKIIAYDPFVDISNLDDGVELAVWPNRLEEADFVVVNCALSKSSFHMLNSDTFPMMKHGVRIVNVGRGPIIDESALVESLSTGHVHSVALDVFENEPLPLKSPLRTHPSCIFGSHNASNTIDGVTRTSIKAINLLASFLQELPV